MRDLITQVAQLNTREKFFAWEQCCDNFIESLKEQSRIKHPRLSIDVKQLLIAHIVRLENLKDTVGTFCASGIARDFDREIDTAFKSHID